MPLPENNAAWPPPAFATALTDMAEHSAWYSGDPDQLGDFYARHGQIGRAVRPAQRETGVRGRIARWWWGAPSNMLEGRAKLHVPLAADVCGVSADLLFAEPVKLTANNEPLQAFLDDLTDGGLDAKLHEGAEVQAALGGVYLAARWDRDVSDTPWPEVVHADAAYPEVRRGRLHAVTFARRLTSPGASRAVWRELEHHEPGRISHGLYVGTDDNLGRAHPLQDHPDTAHLAELVDADGGYDTLVSRLTAWYVPNMLPNRLRRGSPLGRSDLAGITGMLDALDEVYSSWHRDIRLGKARLYVPESLTQTTGPGSGATFDPEGELVTQVAALPKDVQGLGIEARQFAIRYTDHANTCRDWTNTIVRGAGYSASTFGETGDVAMTATEAEQRQQRSYQTRGKKVRYWQPVLRDMLEVMAELANAHLQAGVAEDELQVELAKPAKDTALGLANTAAALHNAGAASTETLVRMVHPEWDKTQVDAEVAKIGAENRLDLTLPPDGIPDDAGL